MRPATPPNREIAPTAGQACHGAVREFSIDGQSLRLRPISPEDAPRLIAGLEMLTDETRLARFFFVKRAFSPTELEHLTHCDGTNHVALIVEWLDDPQRPLVAVGRWLRDPREPTVASIAYITADRWQRRGIGTALVRQLASTALARGITKFRAEVLWGNSAAVKLLDRVGARESERMIGSAASELVYRIALGGTDGAKPLNAAGTPDSDG